MLKQPFFLTSLIILIIIAVLHILALEYYFYWVFSWFDILMHFLGGLWVGLITIWFLFFSGFTKMDIRLTRKIRIFSLSIVSLIIIGGLWEVFEVVAGMIPLEEDYWFDTSLDLVMDTLGATTAFVYAVVRYPKSYQESNN